MGMYKSEYYNDTLQHHGVKGMKWGVRKKRESSGGRRKGSDSKKKLKQQIQSITNVNKQVGNNKVINAISEKAYAAWGKANPREFQYTVKRKLNRTSDTDKAVYDLAIDGMRKTGVVPLDQGVKNIIEKNGIEKHKSTKYTNLSDDDISKFKKYTDAAVYSRTVNAYLATGEPPHISGKANDLKKSLSKNSLNDTTVFRSTSLKFSTNGVAKKLDQYGEKELSTMFENFDKNFKGKSFKENRIYSTSTSPNFAIDTWRKVNPNAAKNYNAYMVIDTKNCPGILADARTSNGKKLVNTRSNQEAILAPNEMVYKKMAYDRDRNMFALYMEAR